MLDIFVNHSIITIYLPVFFIALYFAGTEQEKINICIIIGFFVLSPIPEYLFYSLLSRDRNISDYLLFYSFYEAGLIACLLYVNKTDKRMSTVYFLSVAGFIINYSSFRLINEYADFIYKWYETINWVLLDSTVLSVVKINEEYKSFILAACVLSIPYIIKGLM